MLTIISETSMSHNLIADGGSYLQYVKTAIPAKHNKTRYDCVGFAGMFLCNFFY